jgi:hypothetical protein
MVAALLLVLAASPAPVDTAGVAVRVVRFFRAETGQTQVAAFIETAAVPGGTLTLRVVEGSGQTLWEQSWQRPLDAPAGPAVDHLRFTVAPGEYAVEVALHDSTGTLVGQGRVPVPGFATNPGVSDLLLAPMIRAVHAADTVPRPQEYRRGGLLIAAPGQLRLHADTPLLHYLLEAYTPYGAEGWLAAMVRDALGGVVREAPPSAVRIPAGVGLLSGQLDLAGMRQGRYTLVTILTIGERKFERAAGFEVVEPATP